MVEAIAMHLARLVNTRLMANTTPRVSRAESAIVMRIMEDEQDPLRLRSLP